MSEQQPPPVEHWRGHLDVRRPEPRRRLSRSFFLVLAAAFGAGLLTLGALALWSRLTAAPDVFAWGVVIVSIVCVVVLAAFLLPLPFALNANWVVGPPARLWGPEPLPLVTPALAMVAFAAPSMVALVVILVRNW